MELGFSLGFWAECEARSGQQGTYWQQSGYKRNSAEQRFLPWDYCSGANQRGLGEVCHVLEKNADFFVEAELSSCFLFNKEGKEEVPVPSQEDQSAQEPLSPVETVI